MEVYENPNDKQTNACNTPINATHRRENRREVCYKTAIDGCANGKKMKTTLNEITGNELELQPHALEHTDNPLMWIEITNAVQCAGPLRDTLESEFGDFMGNGN